MNEDAVTWTQVMVVTMIVLMFLALSKISKRISALEDKKRGAADEVPSQR